MGDTMDFTYSNDGFLPYDSFDYIYSERELPEFGKVASPYMKPLTTWRFFLARGQSEIPFCVEKKSYDDSEWALINTPSTWQTEGYGLPQNLIYDYPQRLKDEDDKKELTIGDRFILQSNTADDDEVGIYRSTVVFTKDDLERAIYIETSGICGSFRVYVNDRLAADSHAIYTRKKLLISEFVTEGVNLIVIVVNRYDRDDSGHVILDSMNYGFSGIFRPIMIVMDSLLELSNVHIKLEYVPEAYINEVAKLGGLAEAGKVARVPHGNFMIRVDFQLKNHTNFMIPYSVRISVLEARAEYDPYKLPFVAIKDQGKPAVGVVDALKETRAQTEFVALDVAQWSDCTPVQYDMVFEVLNAENKVVCAKKKRFGFRTTEVVHDKLNINDRRVTLQLTHYYEFDPAEGIAVPQDRIRQDIIMMKRVGINGVIADGFPLSDDFLNLCDQYGMYVIATSYPSVMRDYVESAMNHPSVVMWGVQNYNFDPDHASGAKHGCMLIDDTRPWYCEAEGHLVARSRSSKTIEASSDMKPLPGEAGAVYGPWVDLCLDRNIVFGKNKTGKNLFETIPGRTRFTDDDTMYKWIHHADLVGGKQKENSCIGQGIVDSDRNPHPVYLDIKKQCQTISIFANAGDPTNLTMRNTNPFAYTEELDIEWKILMGGQTIVSGRGSIGEIEPYGSRTLRFPFEVEMFLTPGWAGDKPEFVEMYAKGLSHELVFDITLKLHKDTYYARAGYEVAFFQEILAEEIASPAGTGPSLKNGLKQGASVTAPQLGAGSAMSAPDENLALKAAGADEQSEVMDEIPEGDIIGLNTVNEEGLVEEPIINAMPESVESITEEIITEVINRASITTGSDGICLGNSDRKIGFSREQGGCSKLEVDGFNFIKGSFLPSFYRCPSNIDRMDKSFVLAKTIFSPETDYEHIQETLQFKSSNYGIKDGVFNMVSVYKSFAMKGDVIMYYEVPSADTLRVTLNFTPKYDMVRYGIRFRIVKGDVLCSWYGRGPGESYVDRKNAARLGVFAAGADKIYHPYARPAENSSHTDTQVVKITNALGDGITIRRLGGNPRFDFTVLPYTPEQMNEYLHEEQLMNNDFCEFMCDFCSKEIERTRDNRSAQPVKKGVTYKETFEFKLESHA